MSIQEAIKVKGVPTQIHGRADNRLDTILTFEDNLLKTLISKWCTKAWLDWKYA